MSLKFNQFEGLDAYRKEHSKGVKSTRRLLLAVVEVDRNEVAVIGVEKLYTGSDIAAFKNLPKDVYVSILSLVEELEDKKETTN